MVKNESKLILFFIFILFFKSVPLFAQKSWEKIYADEKTIVFELPQKVDSFTLANQVCYTYALHDEANIFFSVSIEEVPPNILSMDSLFSYMIVKYMNRLTYDGWKLLYMLDVKYQDSLFAKDITIEETSNKKATEIYINRIFCRKSKFYVLSIQGDIKKADYVYNTKERFFNSLKFEK